MYKNALIVGLDSRVVPSYTVTSTGVPHKHTIQDKPSSRMTRSCKSDLNSRYISYKE